MLNVQLGKSLKIASFCPRNNYYSPLFTHMFLRVCGLDCQFLCEELFTMSESEPDSEISH